MDINELSNTAKKLVAPGRGILAADESDKTIKKRFDAIGVDSTAENHRIYRQLLFKTAGVEEYISGVILFDETVRQDTDEGILFSKYLADKGIIPGIKVDKGTEELASGSFEKVTKGLEGLGDRLSEYKKFGARFTKWRAVITIGKAPLFEKELPTDECIQKNSDILAKFAKISQENDFVPIVEPEVLMDGDHSIEKCEEITYKTLKTVFMSLSKEGVNLTGMLLKPNMVIQGKESTSKATPSEVAESTLRCFKEVVSKEVPGVVFLSGGQGPEEATTYLNKMNEIDNVPWELSFSFGRALQAPVLKVWMGKPENISAAQKVFYHRAKMNSLARYGRYNENMDV
jgi:fructose-bisphosphate aldolase class I